MRDESRFSNVTTKPLFVIAEIKAGECKLNGPWTDPLKKNMQYVLAAIGDLKSSLREEAAGSLYDKYEYEDESRKIQLLAVGSRTNQEYARDLPSLDQLLYKDMLRFIYERLHSFKMQKRDQKQWDSAGQFLYRMMEQGEDGLFPQSYERLA